MRRGISSAPDKVILAGVGGSALDNKNIILTTLSERLNPSNTTTTYFQIITTPPPPCSGNGGGGGGTGTPGVCPSEPPLLIGGGGGGNVYSTPQQAAVHGSGQRPALGRPPVKK